MQTYQNHIYVIAKPGDPMWYLHAIGPHTWSQRTSRALPFASQQDAEAFIHTHFKPIEHGDLRVDRILVGN